MKNKLVDCFDIFQGLRILYGTLWEKNATGRLNKLGSFAGFYGIAKECHAYKDNEFNNIVFASSKEYYYGGGNSIYDQS